MSKCERCDAKLWVISCGAGLGKTCLHKEMPEGCTPADARTLRKANHALADELSQRQWIGLTDEEIWSDGSVMGLSGDGIRKFARAIEAKLKEKNR